MKKATKHKVTLVFDTLLEKDYFLGQLSDGWGENSVILDWPKKCDLKDAEEIHVDPSICDYWEHHLKMCIAYPESRPRASLKDVKAALAKIERNK